MSVKSVGPCALVLFLLCLGTAAAEEPLMDVGTLGGAAPLPLPNDTALPATAAPAPLASEQITPAAMPAEAPAAAPFKPGMLSNWILGTRPDCCGPIGGNGPIRGEVYIRSGLSLPVSGDVLARVLEPGWVVEGGGRALIFDTDGTAAWIVDLGISNVWNHARHNVTVTTHYPPTITGKINELNQTFGNIGIGRECYLFGSEGCLEPSCRMGMDVGGRWGTEKLSISTVHRTATEGGTYVALYTDYVVPCGPCLYYFGARMEWDYIWSDIFKRPHDADVMDINLMLTFGIRF